MRCLPNSRKFEDPSEKWTILAAVIVFTIGGSGIVSFDQLERTSA
jgi:hypothetical protein